MTAPASGRLPALAALGILAALAAAEDLSIPGCTAYAEPDRSALAFSQTTGVERWSDAAQQVVWHGLLTQAGPLALALTLELPSGHTSRLTLAVAQQTFTVNVTGTGSPAIVPCGEAAIAAAGFQAFTLTGVAKSGPTFGRIAALRLAGPAAAGAHFNLKPRRNCASVHLGYPIPKDAAIDAFYNEVTVRSEPLWSYYMTCGFHRGYMGIQVNSPSERRIIFSVWDSGGEARDRTKVADEDRVTLLEKGAHVEAGDFGHEGTGGHSHLVHPWTRDTTYRCLVTAIREGRFTIFSGWFFFPEQREWGLIARFRAPKDGGHLRGLYSFDECFNGQNGDLERRAEFGNQWIHTLAGGWQELTGARFTCDATGQARDRIDIASGVVDGRFFLSTGGFTPLRSEAGAQLTRPALGTAPAIPERLLTP